MDSVLALFASCILATILCASSVGGNIIPQPVSPSQPEENSAEVGAGLLVRLRDAAITLDGVFDVTGETGDATQLQAGSLPGHKRSAPADGNLSDSPAAFAVAEDLSGAELAQLLQGLIGDSGAAAPTGIRCSGQPVNSSAQSTFSPYASDECHLDLIAAVTNDEPNTRGLCPWTYVENIDDNRYPSSITYAQCACPSCIREDEQGFSADQGCHPIYFDVKVLRKHACQGGIQIYEADYVRVPVACACLRPRQA